MVIPYDISQVIFALIGKIMQRIKVLKKVVKSSAMTIGSSIMSSETELVNSEIPTANIFDLIEQLNALETKKEAAMDGSSGGRK